MIQRQRMHAVRTHRSVSRHQRRGPPNRPVASAAQSLGYRLRLGALLVGAARNEKCQFSDSLPKNPNFCA